MLDWGYPTIPHHQPKIRLWTGDLVPMMRPGVCSCCLWVWSCCFPTVSGVLKAVPGSQGHSDSRSNTWTQVCILPGAYGIYHLEISSISPWLVMNRDGTYSQPCEARAQIVQFSGMSFILSLSYFLLFSPCWGLSQEACTCRQVLYYWTISLYLIFSV
jgi:hypothetical protein